VKLSETRNYVDAIKHDLKTGQHMQARRKARELFDWQGNIYRATTAELMNALASVEVKLLEVGL
jgi:hypothetical protein